MADVMAEDFEIKLRPIVDITKGYEITGETYQSTYSVINKGSFVVQFRYVETKCWHPENPDNQIALNWVNINKHISPDDSITVHNNFPFSKFLKAVPNGKTEKILHVQILFNFLDVKGSEFEKEMSFRLRL